MAGVGQLDAACVTLEQLRAEVVFQRLDLLADRRRTQVQHLGRAGEILHPRGGLEHAQPV